MQAGLDTPRLFWTFCEVEPVVLAVIEDGVFRVDELLCPFQLIAAMKTRGTRCPLSAG